MTRGHSQTVVPFSRRCFVVSVAIAGLIAGGAVRGADWPNHSIRIVVPFSAGGATDVVARMVAEQLHDRLGQPVVVDNRPGAGSQIGTQLVAKETPDGYTLLFGSSDGLSIVPQVKKVAPYDPVRDFTAIAMVAKVPMVFAVNEKLPIRSLKDLIEYAKAKPGAVTYGSAGNGSILHLASALLEVETGIKMVHVPYKGGAPMMTDLASGQIDLAATTAELAKRFTGKVRAIAQADTRRHPLLPEVPTAAESGFPNLVVVSAFGLVGPAGLPPAVVLRLTEELRLITSTKEFQERLIGVGAYGSFLPSSDFATYIGEENKKWHTLVKDANLPLID